ncbi:sugar ABC transporter permease [Marispirochaeta sp.]|uniref:carbohydrate ABC transporter permease n=1 Tax=Marispirochaeta sp. TaxID=2038653 RepID=UPI0029C70175|nr:sugar ABC transporter permease [Marispirochaeta sp.]
MKKQKIGFNTRRENLWGWILIMPLTLGLSLWVIFPMGLSFVTSLTNWDMISAPRFVGFDNYIKLFMENELFLKSVKVTLYYTLVSVPFQLIIALLISLLLNSRIRFVGVFRTIYYLPSLIPIVVTSIMWLWLYNHQYGLLNTMLTGIGLGKIQWINSQEMVIPSMIIMSIWGVGNIVVIFLAGLQGIPRTLLEAVEIDGGTAWHSFRHVVIPLLSPVILYNLIIGMIKSLQLFTEPYIMTGGGPMNASLSFMLNIYNHAFKYSKMGMANALAWILFIVTLLLSIVIFKTSLRWTYYEGDRK